MCYDVFILLFYIFVVMATHHTVFALLRDYIYLVILAVMICCQILYAYEIVCNTGKIFNQCIYIDIYSYSIVSLIAAMLIMIPFSAIFMYSVLHKSWDMVSTIVTTLLIGLLTYSGIGSLLDIFICRKNDYPFSETIIILATNTILMLALMIFGAKHGHKCAKKKRQESEIRVFPPVSLSSYPKYSVPKLNRNLSLERLHEAREGEAYLRDV